MASIEYRQDNLNSVASTVKDIIVSVFNLARKIQSRTVEIFSQEISVYLTNTNLEFQRPQTHNHRLN